MSRIRENKEMIGWINEMRSVTKRSENLNVFLIPILVDISKSLAVIADKMTYGSGPLFDTDKAKEFLRDNPGKEKNEI